LISSTKTLHRLSFKNGFAGAQHQAKTRCTQQTRKPGRYAAKVVTQITIVARSLNEENAMFRIFRKRKDKKLEAEEVASRPGQEQAFQESLERARRQLGEQLLQLVQSADHVDEDLIEELEAVLISADLGINVTERILNAVQQAVKDGRIHEPAALLPAVQAELFDIIEPCEQYLIPDTSHKPFVILMVGVNGAGKTTTIAKMAQRYLEEGLQVMVAAGDTFRAAAVEQLQTWGKRLNIPVIAQQTGADPAAVAFDALQSAKSKQCDVLIVDTAGRLHTQDNLMEELKKVRRVLTRIDEQAPHEVMLVVDAGTGQNALHQARDFNQAVQLSGITVSKLDGTARGGVLFAIAEELSIPIRFIGLGERAADLRPFDAAAFIHAILPTDQR
jgi:fused signal recognition particle receptor